jgi:predicted amidohydrolase
VTLRLALAQWEVRATASPEAFGARVFDALREARAAGAGLALLPEYAAVEVGAALAGHTPASEAQELAAMVEAAPRFLAALREAVRSAGIWCVAGTLPMRDGARVINAAPFFAPDGRVAFQHKRFMTRFESERWGIEAGEAPRVFDTDFGRLGIAICYDVEFPKPVRAQVEAGAWLILCPSCTDTRHGANRVTITARARAIENQCFVATSPTVGDAPHSACLDVNRGVAGCYGPADHGFAEDGVIAEGTPDAPGWVICDISREAIERVREEGAVRNHRDWPRGKMAATVPAVFA